MKVKKLKWVRKGKFGNLKESFICSCTFKGEDCKLGEVRVFKKGEYCLPFGMFPQIKNRLQTTKTLPTAKSKVQKWFNEFIQSQIT